MLSDDKRAALIEICHDADVRLIRDSKFGHPDYTSVQSSWPALEKLSVAVAEAAVKAERVTASHWQSLYEAQVALNETMHRREIRNEAAVKDAVGGEAVAILNCGEIGPNGEQEEFEIDCEYGALERFTSQHPGKKFKLYTRPQASAAVPEAIELLRCALTGFLVTQKLSGYAPVHWSNRAAKFLAANQPEVKS